MVQKKTIPLAFPLGGIDRRNSLTRQSPNSTYLGQNVRGYANGHWQGGSRPGLGYADIGTLSTAGTPFLDLNDVTYYGASGDIFTMLTALAGTTLYYSATPWGSVSAATLGGLVTKTAEYQQKLYIANHGTTPAGSTATNVPLVFDPAALTVSNWTASNGGTIPKGSLCVCVWRDRLVLGGGSVNPNGIFASKQGDPLNFDYSAVSVGGAWSLALSEAGQIGDQITCLYPHADQCLIVGCRNSIWQIVGDPKYGGQVVNLSNTIGIIHRNAYCTTPDGMFVFMAQDGLYMLQAGCHAGNPIPLSRDFLGTGANALESLTTGGAASIWGGFPTTPVQYVTDYVVSMAYDIRDRGIHISATPVNDASNNSGTAGGQHWWYDWQMKAFWEVTYAKARFQPWVMHSRRNFASSKSIVLLGCQDGQIRSYDSATYKDDQDKTTEQSFTSSVMFGPFLDVTLYSDNRLDELFFVLSKASGTVTIELFRGDTAESAILTDAVETWTIGAGRSQSFYPRTRGPVLYMQLSATTAWAFEAATAILATVGKERP